MTDTPNVTWIEAASVQPGQKQLTMNPPTSEVAYVIDSGHGSVVVVYTDGTDQVYQRNEDLPIIAV